MNMLPTIKKKLESASSIRSFRSCPMRYRLAYEESIRPASQTETLRVGSSYHKCHEIWNAAPDRAAAELALSAHLNEQFADRPLYIESEDWEVEKLTLLVSILGYYNYWQNDPLEILKTELPFKLRNFQGKIDAIVNWQGRKCILERKSTSRDLGSDSQFWNIWSRDVQISLYNLTDLADGILLDVWRKPTIRLKQKETPLEYGKRLAEDIAEKPERYFARRELTRTTRDREREYKNLLAQKRVIEYTRKSGAWTSNEQSCHDPYPCSYRSICYGTGAEKVCDGKTIPDGFVRLTHKGETIQEETGF